MKKFIGSKTLPQITSAFQAMKRCAPLEKCKQMSKDLVKRCGDGQLQVSWTRLTPAFEKRPIKISRIEFLTILKNDTKLPSTFVDKVRKEGKCVVILDVMNRTEVLKCKEALQQYLNNRKGKNAGNIKFLN